MKQKLCHLLFTLANVNAPINVNPQRGGGGGGVGHMWGI